MNFCRKKEERQTLASDKNKKDHKNLRSKRLKLVVDYCQKQNDQKQRIFKHNKENGPKSYNYESQTTTF